ncbi:hypothetical protein FB559_1566 [Actinoallomurus bryophytorum]|uniref:Uncharacterized protein n=1 Tax=Actinoallomurus bryophytorum TaxID=1490222 RepID=A0A543CGJ4_9ACTN|nr:hypothetical protein FB559_1566 [Actinoallomurus bryophytorum]
MALAADAFDFKATNWRGGVKAAGSLTQPHDFFASARTCQVVLCVQATSARRRFRHAHAERSWTEPAESRDARRVPDGREDWVTGWPLMTTGPPTWASKIGMMQASRFPLGLI